MSENGSASPVKADSATGAATPNAAAAVKFTEKEELVLKMAWQCLKSGPPELDIGKLMGLCDFKTQKTAANTWGTVKKKIMSMSPASVATSTEDEDGAATPKPKATPKKRAKKADAADGEDAAATGSPAKKPRATPKKTKPAATKVKAEEDGEGKDWDVMEG